MIFVGSCMFGEDPFFSTLHTVLHSYYVGYNGGTWPWFAQY